MSTAYQGTGNGSSGSTPRVKKTDRSRRSWSDEEEAVLLAAIKELKAQGWKSDNGFKAGYLIKLEEAMKKEFPSTDLKGTPHIVSRLTTWKKNYYMLTDILSLSGVGLSPKNMIDCEDDAWAQIVKADSNAKMLRFKSWPYYQDWLEIFGKDRATGAAAEDIQDAYNEIRNEDNTGEGGSNVNYDVSLEDLGVNESADDSGSHVDKMAGVQRGTGKKRKLTEDSLGLGEILLQIGRNTDKRLAELAARIGHAFDVTKARKEAFDILDQIPGLSLDDKFDVCDLLAKEIEKLDIFMGLREDKRPPYVMRILKALGKYDNY